MDFTIGWQFRQGPFTKMHHRDQYHPHGSYRLRFPATVPPLIFPSGRLFQSCPTNAGSRTSYLFLESVAILCQFRVELGIVHRLVEPWSKSILAHSIFRRQDHNSEYTSVDNNSLIQIEGDYRPQSLVFAIFDAPVKLWTVYDKNITVFRVPNSRPAGEAG